MPLDLGGDPDLIHPQHKQNLATGQHPLGANPAVTSQAMERHASATFRKIIANLQRYGGVIPRGTGMRALVPAMQDMFATLQQVQQIESEHREELEQLAVETVLRLPEFKSLRQAVANGNVKIEPYLNRRIEIPDLEMEDPDREQPQEFAIPQIKAEYQELIHKRKLINTIIQGAAVANNYAFSYYARDEVSAIDPNLIKDYGKIMAYSELGYFAQSPEILAAAAAAQGSELQGGSEKLKSNPDGSITIQASAIAYPMLVQEIIKGCMEYLSMNDEEDEDTRRLVHQQSDFVSDEHIQMQVGPSIYRELIDTIGLDDAEVMPYIHDELTRMPASEFNARMKEVLNGSPAGKTWLRGLAQKIKGEIGNQSESLARGLLD